MCDGTNHKLIPIYQASDFSIPGALDIVRWCMDCGSVVVDKEVDGRTIPGRVRKMQFPASLHKEYQHG